ncbi:hypothetical protein [Myroides fluvii]|uniref:hypothetical protein n=1 Tax=Myroides fluvii TaxID=2572594 RepID=UPI0018EF3188|nr:hypothetical protein [Myroides fluvii]
MEKENKIAVVSQGYVGLPLAVAFAKHDPVVEFDSSTLCIESLQQAQDEAKGAKQFFHSLVAGVRVKPIVDVQAICSFHILATHSNNPHAFTSKIAKVTNKRKRTLFNFNTFNLQDSSLSFGMEHVWKRSVC